jgi:hypothetical protein
MRLELSPAGQKSCPVRAERDMVSAGCCSCTVRVTWSCAWTRPTTSSTSPADSSVAPSPAPSPRHLLPTRSCSPSSSEPPPPRSRPPSKDRRYRYCLKAPANERSPTSSQEPSAVEIESLRPCSSPVPCPPFRHASRSAPPPPPINARAGPMPSCRGQVGPCRCPLSS